MTPTLDSAMLCSSRAGADLGSASDGLRSFVFLGKNRQNGADQSSSGTQTCKLFFDEDMIFELVGEDVKT